VIPELRGSQRLLGVILIYEGDVPNQVMDPSKLFVKSKINEHWNFEFDLDKLKKILKDTKKRIQNYDTEKTLLIPKHKIKSSKAVDRKEEAKVIDEPSSAAQTPPIGGDS
jgi:hypothetical protein